MEGRSAGNLKISNHTMKLDDARLEQETNEDALDRLVDELNFHVDGSAEKASL